MLRGGNILKENIWDTPPFTTISLQTYVTVYMSVTGHNMGEKFSEKI